MPVLSIYFPADFPDGTLAGSTHRLIVPRPDGETTEYILGRAADLALTLAVKTISRHHCAISYSYAADRWAVQDLKSTGGTWLNSQRLSPYNWVHLTLGDKLWLSSNPPICVVEDENDTINPDDDGPATEFGTTPILFTPTPTPDPLPSLPPTIGQYYDDALYLAVQWFTTGKTVWGKLARFLLVVLLATLATVVVAIIVIH